MKKGLFISALTLTYLLSGCEGKLEQKDGIPTDVVNNPASADGKSDQDLPVFQFEKTTHDFGTIKQGEKVAYSYRFTNTGKKDLVISAASGSCGCTVPQYPKMPVPPGGEGVIDVTFDSAGKTGKQNKTITLVANTVPNTTILTITGEVLVPDQQTAH